MNTPLAALESSEDNFAPNFDLRSQLADTVLPLAVLILRRIHGYLNFYASLPKPYQVVLESLNVVPPDSDILRAYLRLISKDASHFRDSLPLWLEIIDKALQALSHFTLPVDADRNTLEVHSATLNSLISCPIVHKIQNIEKAFCLDEVTADLTFDMAL